jgi:RND family efflux transporter MFP subunit
VLKQHSIVGAALLVALFMIGWQPHPEAARAVAAPPPAEAPLHAEATPPPLVLAGSVGAERETAIWARASGYVRVLHADVGDRVEKGQLLAELDTPELDHQLAQARADLRVRRAAVEVARAAIAFSRPQAERYEALFAGGLSTRQSLDEKRSAAAVDVANLHAAEAAVGSQEAEVQRLGELRGFARVTAPFSGVITARNVEEGTLVAAGTLGAGLFHLAATDRVRVFVQVPEGRAASVRAGSAVRARIHELPGRLFAGAVARTAAALDPATHSLRAEVQIPNPGGEILAGMAAAIELADPGP